MEDNKINNTEKFTPKFDPYTGKPLEEAPKEEKAEIREEIPVKKAKVAEDSGETAFFDPVTQIDSARFIGREVPSEEGSFYNDDYREKYDSDEDDEDYYEENDKKSNKTMVALIITAITVLVVFIVVLIFAISDFGGKDKEETENPEISTEEKIPVEDPEEETEEEPEKEPEEKGKNVSYYIAFLPESIMETDEGYSVLVNLYNDNMKKVGNEKIYINAETSISEDGEDLSVESFVYVIENLKDDEVFFKGRINNKTNVLKSVTYRSEILEKEKEAEEEEEDSKEDSKNNDVEEKIEKDEKKEEYEEEYEEESTIEIEDEVEKEVEKEEKVEIKPSGNDTESTEKSDSDEESTVTDEK